MDKFLPIWNWKFLEVWYLVSGNNPYEEIGQNESKQYVALKRIRSQVDQQVPSQLSVSSK